VPRLTQPCEGNRGGDFVLTRATTARRTLLLLLLLLLPQTHRLSTLADAGNGSLGGKYTKSSPFRYTIRRWRWVPLYTVRSTKAYFLSY